MYVHTHHVSQSVRHEHGVSASLYGLFGVALHQSEFLEFVCHHTAYVEMHVHPFHSGLSHLNGVVVTCFYDGVYLQLPLCELFCYGECSSVVRAVVVEFASAVAECQSALLQHVESWYAVHYFSMLAEDGGEAVF